MCGSTTVHSRLLSNVGVLMVGLSVLASSASAQSGGSSAVINGHVQDESGGTLPGVTATLSSPALQVRQIVTVSDADETTGLESCRSGSTPSSSSWRASPRSSATSSACPSVSSHAST